MTCSDAHQKMYLTEKNTSSATSVEWQWKPSSAVPNFGDPSFTRADGRWPKLQWPNITEILPDQLSGRQVQVLCPPIATAPCMLFAIWLDRLLEYSNRYFFQLMCRSWQSTNSMYSSDYIKSLTLGTLKITHFYNAYCVKHPYRQEKVAVIIYSM